MADKTNKSLKYAEFPEQVGICSEEIKALIDDFNDSGIELHSMMLLRDGKVAFESYAAPFGKDIPHAMYSVSKSVTSVAVGFAISEGLLSVDSRVIDFFPEYRSVRYDPNLENLTVYHLLTMTAGKAVSPFTNKTAKDWIKQFFDAPWASEPGKKWAYISENTYICSAILSRVTGMSLTDYLMPRLFEPLGFERKPEWETDCNGIEAGGWGLRLTTEELAKFILCIQQGGKYEDRQVIPTSYLLEAISNKFKAVTYNDNDQSRGYGYFFWQSVMKNTIRCDGMFSQFAVAFMDYDACFVCTCSEADEKKTRDCFFRHFPAMFIDCTDKKPDTEYDLSLKDMPSLEPGDHCITEGLIKSRVIRTSKNPVLNAYGFPVSMLPFPAVYMSKERSGNIDNIILEFDGDECTMIWDEGRDHNSILCGMDGKPRTSKIHLGGMDYTAVSYAAWQDFENLEIRMRPLEAICERRIVINLNMLKGKTEIIPSSLPSMSEMGKTVGSQMHYFTSDPAREAAGNIFSGLGKMIDMPVKGKIRF